MSKNYMTEVAKLLGVEVGEAFQVDGDPSLKDCVFRFSDSDLQLSEVIGDNDTWILANDSRLLGLLHGNLSISKLPWKPKINEEFYIPCIHYSESSMATRLRWRDDNADNKFYQFGLVCKTREEAIAVSKKMLGILKEVRSNG